MTESKIDCVIPLLQMNPVFGWHPCNSVRGLHSGAERTSRNSRNVESQASGTEISFNFNNKPRPKTQVGKILGKYFKILEENAEIRRSVD